MPSSHDALIPPPPNGRVFAYSANAGLGDTTTSGRARLDSIARWLQDAAYLDIVDAGLEDRGSWVVRRMRMSVERFPRFGEPLELRTFCSGASPLAAERRTTITSAEGLVEAVATWVFLDPESGRPKRLGPEFDTVYGASANGRRARTRLRHGPPTAAAERLDWRFRSADLDVAEHVNNAVYWAVAEELMAAADPAGVDVEIEFREPARAGDALVLRDGGSVWIGSEPETLYASIAGLPLA